MENLLSTTIPIPISSTGPIPPFPPLTGWHFDPNSAETVAGVVQFMKFNVTYSDVEKKKNAQQLTCVEEYGGGFFSPYTFKEKRGFISFPKSGNTWIRSLVLAAFGMLIPADVKHIPHILGGVPFPTCGCFLLQKDHGFTNLTTITSTEKNYNSEAILLIRNPFRTIILNRQSGTEGLGIKKTLFIANEGWETYVSLRIDKWEKLYTVWIKGLKRGGIIYFERLQADIETELLRFGGLMGLTWIDKNRLHCALNRARPTSWREQEFAYSRDPYSPAQKLKISEAIDRIQLLLMEYGFDPLPTEMYEFYEPTDLLSNSTSDNSC